MYGIKAESALNLYFMDFSSDQLGQVSTPRPASTRSSTRQRRTPIRVAAGSTRRIAFGSLNTAPISLLCSIPRRRN